MRRILLDECASTQTLALAEVAQLPPQTDLVVHALRQHAGRGREGRQWHLPNGGALAVSVAMRGPFSNDVLHELPLRCADALRDALGAVAPAAIPHIAWKAPNDLVARADGAKLAGLLVDTLVVGSQVAHVVIGLGANLDGAAFKTVDGRAATTLAALSGGALVVVPDARIRDLALDVAARVRSVVRPSG